MFSKISKLTIKITSYCNLACSYCHQLTEDKKERKDFSYYQDLADFVTDLDLAEFVEVTLTGGEISLATEEYVRVVEVLRKVQRRKDVQFSYAVVSNGSNIEGLIGLIDKKILNPKRTTISWDGIYSASKSRKSKDKFDDEFFKNVIKTIGKSRYNRHITITHAITPSTINYLHESLLFALDQGIKNFSFYYIHEADYTDRTFVESFRHQMKLLAEEFIKRYDDLNTRFVYYNWQLLYTKIGAPTDILNMQASTMCQKLGKSIHIDQYGDIYGCIYFGDHRALKLGHIAEGIDTTRINSFIEEYTTKPDCNLGSCGNSHCFECPAANYVHNGAMSKRFANTCELLAIERNIFNEYSKHLNFNDILDIKHYWMDKSHVGTKGFFEKIIKKVNTPTVDLNMGEVNTPIHMPTLKYVQGGWFKGVNIEIRTK